MHVVIALPYIRIGRFEAWSERVSPHERGSWFSIVRDATGLLLGLAWWDVYLNKV